MKNQNNRTRHGRVRLGIMATAVLLAGAMIPPFYSTGTSAIDATDKDALMLGLEGIGELMNRYDTREALAPAREQCNAYDDWEQFASYNRKMTDANRIETILTNDVSDDDVVSWWLIPQEVRTEAKQADNLYGALQIIKASDVYKENARVKAVIDANLTEVGAFMAKLNEVKAEAETLKQELIKQFPDDETLISKLTYNQPLPSGGPGTYTCASAKNLRHYLTTDPNKLGQPGYSLSAYGFDPYYSSFAKWALSYDSTVLDGISLPLYEIQQRAWDAVHEARALPEYSLFNDWQEGDITTEELIQHFFPDFDLAELLPDPDASNEEWDEYYNKLQELEDGIPGFGQYSSLVSNVRYIENNANGMEYTSGAALLPSSRFNALGYEEQLDNIDKMILEIRDITGDNEKNAAEDTVLAPNTGNLDRSENTGTMIALSVATAGALATVGGGLAVARLYSPRQKNLFSKNKR